MNAPTKVEASTLSAAMAKAFAEIEGARKDAENPHFNSKFASLASVIAAVKTPLTVHGLFFTQASHVVEDGVCVETIIHHATGESLSCGKIYVPANKKDAQGFGSALTYARRYGLMTAFGVAPEDDDGNAAAQSYKPAQSIRADTNGQTANGDRKAKLDGTYDTLPKLETATKAFVHTLQSIEDYGELIAWLQTSEASELQQQGMHDLPAWWDSGEGMPEGFEPVAERIHLKKRELEMADSIHPREQTVLDAG